MAGLYRGNALETLLGTHRRRRSPTRAGSVFPLPGARAFERYLEAATYAPKPYRDRSRDTPAFPRSRNAASPCGQNSCSLWRRTIIERRLSMTARRSPPLSARKRAGKTRRRSTSSECASPASRESRLVATLRAGLVALKKGTPPASHDSEWLTSEARDDPLTHASLRELARPLPARAAPARGSCAASRARRWTRTTRRWRCRTDRCTARTPSLRCEGEGSCIVPGLARGRSFGTRYEKSFWREGRAAIPATTK